MPELFYDRKYRTQDLNQIRLIIKRSFRETLDCGEKEKLRAIIDNIHNYQFELDHVESLSSRASASFKVVRGDGDVNIQDCISISDFLAESNNDGLLNKVTSDFEKALKPSPDEDSSTFGITQ